MKSDSAPRPRGVAATAITHTISPRVSPDILGHPRARCRPIRSVHPNMIFEERDSFVQTPSRLSRRLRVRSSGAIVERTAGSRGDVVSAALKLVPRVIQTEGIAF